MSFISELYEGERPLPKSVWMREVHGMRMTLQREVESEHRKGSRHYHGYYLWCEDESILYDMSQKRKPTSAAPLSVGGEGYYPLDDMAAALDDELGKLGFSSCRAYVGSVDRWVSKTGYFGTRIVKNKTPWRTICVEVSW